VAIDPNRLPRDAETLRKIVVDLAEQLDRSLAEQNKYQSLLRELLEAQRNAMLMYTSCGWFFYDLAGLETVQVLRYAARVCDLLAEAGEPSPEPRRAPAPVRSSGSRGRRGSEGWWTCRSPKARAVR